MAVDPRIQNSSGADFDASSARRVMVNSRGFSHEYRRSYCGFSVTPIAQDASGAMRSTPRLLRYSSSRTPRACSTRQENVGRKAAERALRRLGARRVPTQQCPVVFAPEIARGLMGNLLSAADGDAVYRKRFDVRRQARRAGRCGEEHHHDRRRHHGSSISTLADGSTTPRRRLRHITLRWRWPAHAPHRHCRKGHPQKPDAQHLHRPQALHALDRQSLARPRCKTRRESAAAITFSNPARKRRENGPNYRGHPERSLCPADDGFRRQASSPGDYSQGRQRHCCGSRERSNSPFTRSNKSPSQETLKDMFLLQKCICNRE